MRKQSPFVKVQCPFCNERFSISESKIGYEITCNRCGRYLTANIGICNVSFDYAKCANCESEDELFYTSWISLYKFETIGSMFGRKDVIESYFQRDLKRLVYYSQLFQEYITNEYVRVFGMYSKGYFYVLTGEFYLCSKCLTKYAKLSSPIRNKISSLVIKNQLINFHKETIKKHLPNLRKTISPILRPIQNYKMCDISLNEIIHESGSKANLKYFEKKRY